MLRARRFPTPDVALEGVQGLAQGGRTRSGVQKVVACVVVFALGAAALSGAGRGATPGAQVAGIVMRNEEERQPQSGRNVVERDPVLRVGFCRGDNMVRFAHDVGQELARFHHLGAEMVPLALDGDEQLVDIVFCERGSTGIVERKLAANPSLEIVSLDMKWERAPWWQPNPGPALPLFCSKQASVVYWKAASPRESLSRAWSLPKPVVVRFHMEPWYTEVASGVDIAIDCKTDPAMLTSGVMVLPVTYLYMSFGQRASEMSDPRLLGPASAIPKSSTARDHFAGFLASYCSARIVSGSFRAFFFNAMHEYFSTRGVNGNVEALSNCRPRRVREVSKRAFRMRADDVNKFDTAGEMWQHFRFGIAFENSQVSGYITEKVANVKLAGAIPIYWGAPDADKYLNTDAFVWCNVSTYKLEWESLFRTAEREVHGPDFRRSATRDAIDRVMDKVETAVLKTLGGVEVFAPCLEQVEYLEKNPAAFEKMQKEPLVRGFSGGILDPKVYARSLQAALESLSEVASKRKA